MKAPRTVLVVAMRRIGDVLLTTPLIRSLRLAWPAAAIDALVFQGTEGVIAANPDIRRILSLAEGAPLGDQVQMLAAIFRRYDLAISTQPGDRPTFFTRLAGKKAVGVSEEGGQALWKRWLLTRWVPFDNRDVHTVRMNVRLAEALDIDPKTDVVVSWHPSNEARVLSLLPFEPGRDPYAVLHPYPKFTYKMWRQEGWVELAKWLMGRGMRVVFTAGRLPAEMEYVQGITGRLPGEGVDMAGRFSLGEMGFLLSNARVYIGPDTVITHMSAALGVPTVALFGPTNPVKWGPWPQNYAGTGNPYVAQGSQLVGKVFLLQGSGVEGCVPCHEEGCERNLKGYSRCLTDISTEDVISAVIRVCQGRNF